jgi:hypothetical protein
MEENKKIPLFRKLDQTIFEKIDSFKKTPNYNIIQDFYNSLEEEQQKIFKGLIVLLIFLLPLGFIGLFWWQNNSLRDNLVLRTSIISKANQIIGQSQALQEVTPRVFSLNPIDGQSMMTSRLSSILSSSGIDLSKIQVSNFISNQLSSTLLKSEANFSFNNVSTDELINIVMSMISREKFRVSAIDIKRNADTNMLQGQFHAIHFSQFSSQVEGEE